MSWAEDAMTWDELHDAQTPTPRERADAVLRDVGRSGGVDNWSHLSSHGHSYSTVAGCVRRGELVEPEPRRYRLP